MQVTFFAMYHLLSFGSGWDALLRQRSQRGCAETVQFAVLGMHISGQRMDHHWMKASVSEGGKGQGEKHGLGGRRSEGGWL